MTQGPFLDVSHPRFVAVLAHYQPLDSGHATPLPADVADLLVQRMAAERISRVLIRMFPPDSVFLPAKDFPQHHRLAEEEELELPTPEPDGRHFHPADPARQKAMYRADALAVIGEYVWA